MKVSVSIVVLSFLYGISSVPINASRICASKKKNIENILLKENSHGIEDVSDEIDRLGAETNQSPGLTFETCNNFCYALWQEDKHANGSKITILFQGCWKQSGDRKCENAECVAPKESTKALNNTKFCCCNGDYCNQNITNTFDISYGDNEVSQIIPESTGFLERVESDRWMIIIGSVVICTLIVILAITLLVCRVYRNNILGKIEKSQSSGDGFTESTALRTGTYTVDHLKLTSIVGQGRYGSVWQGSMGDRDVAVKIFPSHYRNYFQNERDTYCLPFMEHPSLLSYYGVDERVNMEGNTDYLLVLSFAPRGTLTDFLRSRTVDWATFCKMGLSIVKGLAYLHTDIRKGDKMKPCIAHRDMNSRNILIKNDGSCCICDLGLAVQISGSKYFTNGEEQHAETKSINDVGTLRYMAPEVLEGAVNLRDCESSLKQIDVYAMGLILWEIVSRCSDIYVPGSEVPAYKQPFEKEIGLHPTFEEMQVLVSRNKARPILEGNLVDRPGVRLIKETMEDCWDSDAEARLTALCIEERLTELQSHRVTVYFADGSPMVNLYSALVPPTTSSLFCEVVSYHDNIHVPQSGFNTQQEGSRNDSTSDNPTAQSPYDASHTMPEHNCKNSNQVATCKHSQATLQPYQGRNPCMERNLMLPSDSRDELGSNSKVLVDRSSKHVSSDQYKLHAELQGLIPHDYPSRNATQLTGQPRPATPIPYVQNVITENGVLQCNKRKQTNQQHESGVRETPRRKKFAGWSNIKRLLAHKKMYPYVKCQIEREDSKSNLLSKQPSVPVKTVDTNVTISPGGKYVNGVIAKSSESLSKHEKSNVQATNRRFVDDEEEFAPRPSSLSLVNIASDERCESSNLARQESIDKFNQVFNIGSNSIVLKHPNMRIKTPGDLPPSVRKVRGRGQSSARFSLYDDRIMCNIFSDEDSRDDKTISNSVPFGMDFGDIDGKNSTLTLSTKNVTCF